MSAMVRTQAKGDEEYRGKRSQGRRGLVCVLAAVCAAGIPLQSLAQSPLGADLPDVEFGARKIFLMLFLMLGPIKILVPFKVLAGGLDRVSRRRIATRAILFSAAALAIAGLLGRTMLENLEISLLSWR